MAKIKNVFTRVMDKETDSAYVGQGFTRHVENIRTHTNNGGDGVGQNIKGTLKVSDSTDCRKDVKCVTALHNADLDVIYYYLASESGIFSKIVEYNIDSGETTDILHDELGVLRLDESGYITGINEVDGLLYWAELGNNPRRINVERAKTYGLNGFTEDDIKVIVKPPLQKLKITLENTNSESQQENNIEEKFVSFSYRYRYLDGEYSVLAPFTLFAFKPKKFRYDFSEQSNRSMINAFNQVSIDFWTGNERVTEIQLVFKESESNSVWIIDDFNKYLLGYNDNEIKNFKFSNNKVLRALSKEILPNIYDSVPLTAKSQEIIDGRLLYGYYKENYDIKDVNREKIRIDYSLELVALPNTVDKEVDTIDEDGNSTGTEIIQVPSLFPKRTVKSNRDYEVGLVYGDGDGRITTLLNSMDNTIYIPNGNSVTQNSIDVILKHRPPYWAKFYRFFIKQNQKNYDQILPSLFYEDGVYRWIKLEGADKDKVKEGDYLIVKSDTQKEIDNLIKVKVLEVKLQEKNFLQPPDVNDEIVERSGLYFKIKPKGFRIDIDDYETFTFSTYDNTRRAYNRPIRNLHQYISPTHYYGDSGSVLVSNSPTTEGAGVYTGGNNESNRYLISIDEIGIGGSPDTFTWSDDNGQTTIASHIPITAGTPQDLNKGVQITFEKNNGHDLSDEWTINARGTWTTKNDSRAYAFYRTVNSHGEPLDRLEDEKIANGARIHITYDEYGRGDQYFDIDHISSDTYDNIQEWFEKEDIMTLISAQTDLVRDDIHFMRGLAQPDDNATQLTQDDLLGTMTMTIRSAQHGTAAGTSNRVKVSAFTEIIQNDSSNYLLFETQPKDQPSDIYFEIGKNYRIIDGYHSNVTDDFQTEIDNVDTDQPQTDSQDLRVKLDWFNAFSYGNAVESYKIRDEFNAKGLDVGVRPLSDSIQEYKEVIRKADITWSDIYNDESSFNGLNSFNLSLLNFIKLDKEDGTIQKLMRFNDNIIVFQEDAIGIMPYNKQIIYDATGGQTVGISTNILDRRSYRPYGFGRHGVSKNPESIVRIGSRTYLTDEQRGNLLRIANNGVTTINENFFEHEFSNLMHDNKDSKFPAGYDPVHDEYVLYIPSTKSCLSFKESAKGFPNYFTFEPDFMLNANNDFYAWKNGVMFKLNATENRNEYFGKHYDSKIKFFVNQEASIEKVFHAMGIEGNKPWTIDMKTKLTSRTIYSDSFVKKEDYWFSEIMGNTNGDISSSSVFGLGSFEIINGIIKTKRRPETMSVGDTIISSVNGFEPTKIVGVTDDRIVLDSPINFGKSFLMYGKNQNIDGTNIRGDVLEIVMTNSDTDKVELRAVNVEVVKSDLT